MKEIHRLVAKYRDIWKDKDDYYWLCRLGEEMAELTLTIDGQHEGPMGRELRQIASIAINWLYWLGELAEDDDMPELKAENERLRKELSETKTELSGTDAALDVFKELIGIEDDET